MDRYKHIKKPLDKTFAKRVVIVGLCAGLFVNFVIAARVSEISLPASVLLFIACFVLYPVITKNKDEKKGDGLRFTGGCLIHLVVFLIVLIGGGALMIYIENITAKMILGSIIISWPVIAIYRILKKK